MSACGQEARGCDLVTLWVICPPDQLWAEASFQGAACSFMLVDTEEHLAPGDGLRGTGDYTLEQLTC